MKIRTLCNLFNLKLSANKKLAHCQRSISDNLSAGNGPNVSCKRTNPTKWGLDDVIYS